MATGNSNLQRCKTWAQHAHRTRFPDKHLLCAADLQQIVMYARIGFGTRDHFSDVLEWKGASKLTHQPDSCVQPKCFHHLGQVDPNPGRCGLSECPIWPASHEGPQVADDLILTAVARSQSQAMVDSRFHAQDNRRRSASHEHCAWPVDTSRCQQKRSSQRDISPFADKHATADNSTNVHSQKAEHSHEANHPND